MTPTALEFTHAIIDARLAGDDDLADELARMCAEPVDEAEQFAAPSEVGHRPPHPGMTYDPQDHHYHSPKNGASGSPAAPKAQPAHDPNSIGLLNVADKKARGLLSRLAHLPAHAAVGAFNKAKSTYAKYEQRYGPTYAKAIVAAGVLGMPIPLPGAAIGMMAAVRGVAELHRYLRKRSGGTFADETLDAAIVAQGAAELLAELGITGESKEPEQFSDSDADFSPEKIAALADRLLAAARGKPEEPAKTFSDDSDHPRGQPDNAGQFVKKGEGGGKDSDEPAKKEKAATSPELIESVKDSGGSAEPNEHLPDESRPELSERQIREVQSYLDEQTEYYDLNDHLRSGGKLHDDTLQKAIQKCGQFTEEVTAARGISVDDPAELVKELESGEFTDLGFMSASTQRSFPGNVQFTIKTKTGLDASFYGNNSGEILLPAGSKFKVSELKVEGKRVRATLTLDDESEKFSDDPPADQAANLPLENPTASLLEIAYPVLLALKAAGADDDADDLAEMMGDPERAGDLAELLADDPTSTFASAHQDGQTWQTGKFWFKRENGKTRRTKNPNATDEPKKERTGPTPQERAKSLKEQREPGRQAAREAYSKAREAPHTLTHEDIPALVAHLDTLTVPELRQHAKDAAAKLGGKKAELVARLVEKLSKGVETPKEEPKPEEPAVPDAPAPSVEPPEPAAKPVEKPKAASATKPTTKPAPTHTPEQVHDFFQKSGSITSGPKNSELNAAAESILNMNAAQVKDLAAKIGVSAIVAKAKDKNAELARYFLDRRQRAIGVQILNAEGSRKERQAREEHFNKTLGDEPLMSATMLANRAHQSKHKPSNATSTPDKPPSPGFTGTDANGHEWRDGEQVAKAAEPGKADAPAPQAEPPAKAKEPASFESADDADAWGRKHFGEWAKSLSPDERKAIGRYRFSDYRPINAALRGSNGSIDGAEFDKSVSALDRPLAVSESDKSTPAEVKAAITNMDKALSKASLPEDVTVHRGITGDFAAKLKPGESFTDHGFGSTSLSADAGDNYAAGQTMMRVKVPKGTNAAYITALEGNKGHEQELLLPRGMEYKITGETNENGKRVLTAEIVPSKAAPEAAAQEPPAKAKEPHEMTREEFEAALASHDPDKYATKNTIDWGQSHQQGKRSNGMVTGGMADPPKGKKTYTDKLGGLGLSDREKADVRLQDEKSGGIDRYAQARSMGLGHDDAFSVMVPDEEGGGHAAIVRNAAKNDTGDAWKRTAAEEYGDDYTEASRRGKEILSDRHRAAVEAALAAGKPVPPEVLADYPDLDAKHGTPAPKAALVAEAPALQEPATEWHRASLEDMSMKQLQDVFGRQNRQSNTDNRPSSSKKEIIDRILDFQEKQKPVNQRETNRSSWPQRDRMIDSQNEQLDAARAGKGSKRQGNAAAALDAIADEKAASKSTPQEPPAKPQPSGAATPAGKASIDDTEKELRAEIKKDGESPHVKNGQNDATRHAEVQPILDRIKATHTPQEIKELAKRITGSSRGRKVDDWLDAIRADMTAVTRLVNSQNV